MFAGRTFSSIKAKRPSVPAIVKTTSPAWIIERFRSAFVSSSMKANLLLSMEWSSKIDSAFIKLIPLSTKGLPSVVGVVPLVTTWHNSDNGICVMFSSSGLSVNSALKIVRSCCSKLLFILLFSSILSSIDRNNDPIFCCSCSEGTQISRFFTTSVWTRCLPEEPTIDFIAGSRTAGLHIR